MIVTVTTALPLTADQKKKLVGAIEKKHGEVELQETVDETVVGGLSVHFGSTEYNATVSGKLAQLRQELLEKLG